MGFIAIDFETSCSSMDSACSLGVAIVQDGLIIDKRHYYIQPPNMDFDYINVKIHGITPEMVRYKPKFPVVWEEIKGLFYENIVIAHNANFDISILRALQAEYEIQVPNFLYTCSMDISSLICPHVGGSLPDRASYFGIDTLNHHDALDDAISCANIVLAAIMKEGSDSIGSFLSRHPDLGIRNFYDLNIPKTSTTSRKKTHKYFSNIKPNDIVVNPEKSDCTHMLYDKQVVVTGDFETVSRRDAFQMIADVGGILKSGVSRKTNILVVGKQDKSIVGEDGMSTKEEKAYALIEQGYEIRIINEEEFYMIMNI